MARARGNDGRFAPKSPPAEPPPGEVPSPPTPREVDTDEGTTEPPPGEGGKEKPMADAEEPPPGEGGKEKAVADADGKKANWRKIGGLAAIAVAVFGIWGILFWLSSDDESAKPAPIVQVSVPAIPPFVATPAPQAQLAPAPVVTPTPAPAPSPPPTAAPAPPPPEPKFSAEEQDKRIAGLTDGDEVKGCLSRMKSWDVDLSTPSAFDSEAENCRKAAAAK